ncbi:expressed unknown protein [Seminavis robusta]|uniref:Uncharacterized protein n=1 Tax=Seminavis robusta TaxID=568900 RepID=A0A9N8HTZ8_9STRA|nr:expressed unknown protein [Seminavis robusta]|eukprot:Sro1672_g290120.1 n/a (201) ;mRNA; r:5920-6522
MCPTTDNSDPHEIEARFWEFHQQNFGIALREIRNGQKEGCWSWYFFPTPPYIVDGVERGSSMNRSMALRGDDAVHAFLTFQKDGVDLRRNYIAIATEMQTQLQRSGMTLLKLVGPLDDAKAISSFRLFEKVGAQRNDEELYVLCGDLLELCGQKRAYPVPTAAAPPPPAAARKKRRMFKGLLFGFLNRKKSSKANNKSKD